MGTFHYFHGLGRAKVTLERSYGLGAKPFETWLMCVSFGVVPNFRGAESD